MDWHISGSPITFPLQFLVEGQFVAPDLNSIRVTLRGNTGAILQDAVIPSISGSGDPITMSAYDPNFPAAMQEATASPSDAPTGMVLLTINSTQHIVTGLAGFESRFLSVAYSLNGAPFTFERRYKICPFLAITTTQEDVRNLLGVLPSELPDADIDLHHAYFWLKAMSPLTIPAALVSNSMAPLHLSRAVALNAAIEVIPSLMTRLMAQEKSHDASYHRTLDLKMVKKELDTALGAELELMVVALESATYSAPTRTVLSFASNGTDVITGA